MGMEMEENIKELESKDSEINWIGGVEGQWRGRIKTYPRLSLEFYAYKVVSSSSQEMGRLSAKSAFLTIGDFCIE